MSKFALLIGINYSGTSAELKGCVNDVQTMKNYLIDTREYQDANIVVLTDDQATNANIMGGINTLIGHGSAEELWLHYSGHGSTTRDRNGDEDDGKDETIVPVDYQSKGMITDDTLHATLTALPEVGPKLYCIFDCCHSGTILDLKYQYRGGSSNGVENPAPRLKGNVIMVSGCMDTQTSADAHIGGKYCGAMTSAYVNSIKDGSTCSQLLDAMRDYLKSNNYTQYPQMSSSSKIDAGLSW
jgi:hypothetical protein